MEAWFDDFSAVFLVVTENMLFWLLLAIFDLYFVVILLRWERESSGMNFFTQGSSFYSSKIYSGTLTPIKINKKFMEKWTENQADAKTLMDGQKGSDCAGSSGINLHLEFVRLGREKYRLANRLLFILPDIYESGIYKKYASDIYKYAGRFGGISKSAVDKRLRLEKHLENKPCLRAAIEKVGVNKVALMATLATPQADAMVADKVLNMNKSALQTLSKELRHKGDRVESDDKNNRELCLNDINPCQAAPQTITIELDQEMTFLFLKFKKKSKSLSNKETMKRLLEEADGRDCESGFAKSGKGAAVRKSVIKNPVVEKVEAAKIMAEKSVVKPVKVVTGDNSKRYIKASLKRQTIGNGQCQYPNCNKPSEHIHHPERYSITKSHNDLVALCRDHHQFMHNGLIENEQAEKQNWALNIYKTLDETDRLYRKYRGVVPG